ncbi:MAG: efflux RND transporter periplasmic adaptor subunit, partial [Gammaproteobacteria bacterium]
PVTGVAQRVELEVGDNVKRGQHLLSIEPLRPTVLDPRERAQAQARVAAAEASLRAAEENARAAKTEAELAERESARISKLCQIQCASQQEQDQAAVRAQTARASQRSAQFAVKVARYELEAARTALTYTAGKQGGKPAELVPVDSPIDGRILKIEHESEGVVQPGTPLLELGDPRALEVETEVLSEDAVRIHPGTPVVYERWGGGEDLQGTVTTVEPVAFTKVSALGVEEQRVLVISDITSDTKLWRQLGDGYRVEARFILWRGDDVLQVPASALFRYGDGWAVFAVRDGRARRQQVELGHRNGLAAQIVKGLTAGEQVIVHPDDTIADGKRVRIR